MVATTSKGKRVAAKSGRAEAPGGTCGLRLSINGKPYQVRPIAAEFAGLRAFRLTKPDGTTHDISHGVHGSECTCADFVFRREGLDPKGCRHIRAARACGLL